MRNILCLSVFAMFLIVVSGCAENKTRIGEGAGIGGILGAAAGGIIGHQSGHGWEGALIGGAAGAGGGALVGSQIEKPNTTSTTTTSTGSMETVTLQKVVDLTQQGQSGDEIIAKINASHSSFSLTKDDVDYLRKQGVSQRVIEAMQAAR
jgi:uncharacterized protein YcfJ